MRKDNQLEETHRPKLQCSTFALVRHERTQTTSRGSRSFFTLNQRSDADDQLRSKGHTRVKEHVQTHSASAASLWCAGACLTAKQLDGRTQLPPEGTGGELLGVGEEGQGAEGTTVTEHRKSSDISVWSK